MALNGMILCWPKKEDVLLRIVTYPTELCGGFWDRRLGTGRFNGSGFALQSVDDGLCRAIGSNLPFIHDDQAAHGAEQLNFVCDQDQGCFIPQAREKCLQNA